MPRLGGRQLVLAADRRDQGCLTGRVFLAGEALVGGLGRTVCPANEVPLFATQITEEIAPNTAPVSAVITRHLL